MQISTSFFHCRRFKKIWPNADVAALWWLVKNLLNFCLYHMYCLSNDTITCCIHAYVCTACIYCYSKIGLLEVFFLAISAKNSNQNIVSSTYSNMFFSTYLFPLQVPIHYLAWQIHSIFLKLARGSHYDLLRAFPFTPHKILLKCVNT